MIIAPAARVSGVACRTSRCGASFGLRGALAAGFTALLVACGGGGGGGSTPADEITGPPATAASLSNTTVEAERAAQAVVAGADAAANRVGSLSGLSALVGGPVVPQSLASAPRRQILAAGHARPLAVQTAACAEILDPAPCTGSATMDTNIADNAIRANPGDYADIQFASLSGLLFGQTVVMNGRVRVDFLSALDLDSTQFNGLDLKLKFDGFSGSINGASFGPASDTARFQISAQGVVTFIAGGASYTGLHGVSIGGAGSYSIAGGTVRVGYWADSGRYVDLTLQSWRVVAGRPAVGSQATVMSGQDSATLAVTSSTAGAVVYSLTISAAGSTTHYFVLATYPAVGGGAPHYAAIAAP